MTVAISLPLLTLSDDERALTDRMLLNLANYEVPNKQHNDYYEGEQLTRQFGISVPPSMRDVRAVAGWSGTVVDVLEERLDFLSWMDDDDLGLSEVYTDNGLDVDSGDAHLDALIFGTAFVTVGTGEDGEPSPLITPHSPRTMTVLWSSRTRRGEAALALTEIDPDDQMPTVVTLYQLDQTVTLSRVPGRGNWSVEDRDRHNQNRLMVAQLLNRTRASRMGGRSEITKAVRYYTDAACRTLLGSEVNREFYSSPQRWAMGVSENDFKDAAGNTVSPWSSIQGRVWALDRDEDGELPQVGQFTPASPAPYLDQVKGLAQLLAAEASIPPSYLGFQTDNPASADAILRSEARLVKRAERRQSAFGRAWLEVARLALLVRDGSIPADFSSRVGVKWRDAATPTRSAQADEATKLISASVLLPDSEVTYDRVGLDATEQRTLTAEKRRARGQQVISALSAAADQARASLNGDGE